MLWDKDSCGLMVETCSYPANIDLYFDHTTCHLTNNTGGIPLQGNHIASGTSTEDGICPWCKVSNSRHESPHVFMKLYIRIFYRNRRVVHYDNT